MKKIFGFLKGLVVNLGANALIDELTKVGDDGLEEFFKNDPLACTSLVKGLHAWIPYLQRLAEKTETPLDDKAVAEIKQEIEEFCARHEISL